ncbi:MAG: hypothetical protein P8Y00_05760 [Deltaproteobacteria bacterium]
MIKLKWILPVWMMLTAVTASGQSLIGQSKEEVSRRVSMYHKEFRKDNMVVSQHFNYLKYVNGMRTRTWILYFDDENVCHLSKLVCDYSEYDSVLEQLNDTYRKTGESKWEFSRGGQSSVITLTKQEYYFTVREESRDRSETM